MPIREVTKKTQALQIMVNMTETMTHKRMQQYVVMIKYVCHIRLKLATIVRYSSKKVCQAMDRLLQR